MAGAFTKEAETRLWIPGVHTHDLRVRRIAALVEEYDHSLRFAKHEITGDWVVIIGENGYPVFGFGTELPDPRDVHMLLARHDIKRHGAKIMDALAKEAEGRRRVQTAQMDEIHWGLAERYEHARRQELEGRRSAGGRTRSGNGRYNTTAV